MLTRGWPNAALFLPDIISRHTTSLVDWQAPVRTWYGQSESFKTTKCHCMLIWLFSQVLTIADSNLCNYHVSLMDSVGRRV